MYARSSNVLYKDGEGCIIGGGHTGIKAALKPQRAAPVDIGKYVDTDTWWEEFDVDNDDLQSHVPPTPGNIRSDVESEPKLRRTRSHDPGKSIKPKKTSSNEVTDYSLVRNFVKSIYYYLFLYVLLEGQEVQAKF